MGNSNVDEKAKETSKQIKILIQERKLDEAIKLTEEYPDDHVIQSQRISIAFLQNDLETVRKIANREGFKDKRTICAQRIKLALMERNTEEAERLINEAEEKEIHLDERVMHNYKKSLAKQKNQKTRKESKAEPRIQQAREFSRNFMAKLYDNTIQQSDIQEIEESKILSEYDKTCMMLAIYEKNKNRSAAKKVYKQYKSTEPEEDKLRKINKIMQRVGSKKAKIFDYEFYEEMLGLKNASNVDRNNQDSSIQSEKSSFEARLKFDSIDYSAAIDASLAGDKNKYAVKDEVEQK